MTNIISVFFVEDIVCNFAERGPPEYETFFKVQPDTFEKQSVLETTVMFEVSVAAEGSVEVLHTERE